MRTASAVRIDRIDTPSFGGTLPRVPSSAAGPAYGNWAQQFKQKGDRCFQNGRPWKADSTNIATAPRSTKTLAVETKVNDGIPTWSPGLSRSSAAISSADVHECVTRARRLPIVRSSHDSHRADQVKVARPMPVRP